MLVELILDRTSKLRVTLDGYNPRQSAILRAAPCKTTWARGKVLMEPTAAVYAYMSEMFPTAQYDAAAQKRKAEIQSKEAQGAIIQQQKEKPQAWDTAFPYKTEPYKHQEHALALSVELPNFALFMEQGTGKTKVMLDTAAYLHERGEIDGVLVVAPNGVHVNWLRNEIPVHLPDWCDRVCAAWRATARVAEKRAIEAIMKPEKRLRIFTMNIEALSSDRGIKTAEKFLKTGRMLFVLDEGHTIKTPGSRRTKSIVALGRLAPYKRLLTGTPITQGYQDLFSQFAFLDKDILGFSSFYTFKARYLVMGGFEDRAVVAYKNSDELLHKVDGYSYTVLKKDCLDLPERTYKNRYVEMSSEQRKHYDELCEELRTQIEDHEFTITAAIVKLLRLRQILGGFMTVAEDPGRVIPIPGTNTKMSALLSELGETPGQAIIWATFRAELEAIGKALNVPVYYGGTKTEERTELIDKFQAGEMKYFVANPKAAGTGLTLTAAGYTYWYSNDFSLATRLQADDRNHRIGQTKNVLYTDLICAGTIDEHIHKALRKKRDLASTLSKDEILAWL